MEEHYKSAPPLVKQLIRRYSDYRYCKVCKQTNKKWFINKHIKDYYKKQNKCYDKYLQCPVCNFQCAICKREYLKYAPHIKCFECNDKICQSCTAFNYNMECEDCKKTYCCGSQLTMREDGFIRCNDCY
jgi:hypothetical protein